MSAVTLADGPAMFLGSSIMSFALPCGAFIVVALVLFYLYRTPHAGPRLKYLTSGPVASLLTREPGPIPAPPPASSAQARAPAGAEPAPTAAEPAPDQGPAADQVPAADGVSAVDRVPAADQAPAVDGAGPGATQETQ